METINKPLIDYFTRISVFCAFAPYYSFKDKWKKLLCCLCKKSKMFWEKNQKLLDNLDYLTFADEYEMVELLKNLFVEDESVEELCRLNKILLRLIQNPKGCCEFIKLAGDYKLKKLSWFGMSACSALPDEYIIDLERFAFNTLPNTIKTITLQGCSDVERFLTFLSIALPKGCYSIKVCYFNLNEESLKLIFTSCVNVRNLHFIGCNIATISSNLTLSLPDSYKLTFLNFYKCKIDLEVSLKNVTNALSSNIGVMQNLKKVNTYGLGDLDKIKNIFESSGFEIDVTCDKKYENK